MDLFHTHGIKVHGLFMAGIDTDTAGQADATVRFAQTARHRHHPDHDRNADTRHTHLYRRAEAEGRIVTDDWSLFDGHHAVMRPANAHPYDVQVQTLRAVGRSTRCRIWLPAVHELGRHAPELVRLSLRSRLPARLPTLASRHR